MKTKILILSVVAFFTSNLLVAQQPLTLDPATHTYQVSNNTLHTPQGDSRADVFANCSDTTFWAVNSAGGIEEFVFTPDLGIQTLDIFYNGFPGQNLAIANVNNIVSAPTFYGIYDGHAYYSDGTNWIEGSGSTSGMFANLGGYGDYLYTMTEINGTYLNSILRYNGNGFDTILMGGTTNFACADIAVDEVGNIWALRSNDSLYIDVISPQGNLLKRFNVPSFNNLNAYGCFLLNDKFYVGIGMQNPDFNSVLIPFTISSDTAIQGTPISMSLIDYVDLASCNPGNPLKLSPTGITSPTPAPPGISIFPNPVVQSQTVTIKSNVALTKITLRDMAGRIVKQIEGQNAAEVIINTQGFAKGLYLVETYTGSERPALIQKLVIE